jgi:P4 family phage/plasmid primase-like protien
MRALLTRHIEERFRADYQVRVARYERQLRAWQAAGATGRRPSRPILMAVRVSLVRDVTLALQAQALLEGACAMPCLLPDGKAHNYLALDNGVLDLDAQVLQPHTPDWFSSVCLPYSYEPDAEAPRWMSLLQRNLEGDGERIHLLQEFFGYCLIKTTDSQACLILVGEGGNGKSVVLAALRAMLGADNVSTVPLEQFAQRFAMAQTLGKLANVCPEVGEIDRTAEGTLKSYISGDAMFFEKKGKDGFTAIPTARLVLATNNVPRFIDKSEGIWRRLLLMPMNVRVPPGERIPGLDKEAYWVESGEMPGILNWALAGLRRLRAQGWRFTQPTACAAALAEHRLESDPSRAFLLERYVEGDGPVASSDLYQEYRLWCEANGHRNVMSQITFGKQVGRLFPQAESRMHRFARKQVERAWFGLQPRNATQEASVRLQVVPFVADVAGVAAAAAPSAAPQP